LSAHNNGQEIILSWTNRTANKDSSIFVDRKTSEDEPFTQVAKLEGGSSQYTDKSVYKNTTYYYRLRTFSNDNHVYSYPLNILADFSVQGITNMKNQQ
jgi:hypothetical protein